MTTPNGWTTEEAERLGRIARGEECPHLSTLDVFTRGEEAGVTICVQCGTGIASVVVE